MTETYVNQPRPKFAEMTIRMVVQVAILGAILGAIAWLVAVAISNFVIDPLFCKADGGNFSVCAQGGLLASNIASLLVGGLAVVALLRLGIFRPLLIALAVVITLWGLGPWMGALAWYESLAWTVVLYAVAYLTFSWLARIRIFWIALLATVVVIVATRLISSL
ncbi:MAG: hypothetical protein WAZ21_04535 [Candidatus Saccharimonadales bacterium]